MRRAAIYNRFWHSMGGGERHSGMIAQVLSQSGVEVDLITHSDVDIQEVADRLALDLSKTTLRVIPDHGPAAVGKVSESYDLFVNSTYLSRVESRARRSAYLCFFPTPFDHDLNARQKAMVKLLGPHVDKPLLGRGFRYGLGWFPPEGGRRRQWAWTCGDAELLVAGGTELSLLADFGRPGTTADTDLVAVNDDGVEVGRVHVTPEFRAAVISVPASPTEQRIRLTSGTFVPSGDDPRELGVAISRLRVGGARLGLKGRAALRWPYLLRNPNDFSFLTSYDVVLANSAYTQDWITRFWSRDSEILYPPIEVDKIVPAPERAPVILSVGRFFAPGHGHAKRQLEMVRMFAELTRSGQLPGWKFVVLGGCEDRERPYLEAVTRAAADLPVEIHANAPRSLVESMMSTASIFWSATGMGEDTDKRPWTNEHFGMTTAEAMAGGCVPVVIDKAGQREIVREGVDGFRWSTPEQCRIRTVQVATDPALRARLAAAAIERVREYSDDAFAARWQELASTYDLI